MPERALSLKLVLLARLAILAIVALLIFSVAASDTNPEHQGLIWKQ